MKSSCLGWVLAGLVLVNGWGAGIASAQTRQQGVLGFGFGLHSYAKTDEVRENFFLSDVNAAGMSELFGEWYPIERFGIGLRMISTLASETVYFLNAQVVTDYSMTATLVTGQAFPFITDNGYLRIGLIGGLGGADFKLTQTIGSLSVSAISSGTATLLGAFLDWGGDLFGARAGVHWLNTDLDPISDGIGTRYEVDSSGTSLYVDLRWAFG